MAVVLYAPLLFMGYGSDNDTYAVVDVGRQFAETGEYVPSRNPGYLVHETATLVLRFIGGSFLSNVGSLLISLIFINCFQQLCQRFAIPHSAYLTTIVVVHPLMWINSTSTIDYVWALGFLFAGFLLLLKQYYVLAGVLLGLAIGARLSSFIAVAGVFGFAWWVNTEENLNRTNTLIAVLVACIVGAICYVPSLIYTGWTLKFLTPGIGGAELWTPTARLGRFIYKNIYFWGLPATVFFIYIFSSIVKNRARIFMTRWFALSLLSVVMIVGYEALFLKFPVENEYLLPMLPFSLFLVGIILHNKPRAIIVLAILVASFNFFNLNIAHPNVPGQATNASFGLWSEHGVLIQDIRERIKLRGCDSLRCWNEVMNPER